MNIHITKRMTVVTLLFSAAAVIATNVATLTCGSCGNSNDTRSLNTRNLITTYTAANSNSIQVNDTITVNGGDQSRGVYKRLTKTGSVQYACVSNCGPGDQAPWFIPLSGGGGGNGGGGGGGGGGGINPPGGCFGSGCGGTVIVEDPHAV